MSKFDTIEGAQRFLREMLEDLLHADPLYADARVALSQPGKLLCLQVETHNGLWPLLVWFIARVYAPTFDVQTVGRGALAMECLVCSFDLYDDIEDEETTSIVAELGHKRVTMAATALWSLGQSLLLSLHTHMADELFLSMFTGSLLKIQHSIEGQHLDILASRLPWTKMSEEQILEISRKKSGSLASLACLLGSTLGGAGVAEIELWSELGLRLGAAKQIHNDCFDMDEDWQQGKKTLPILLSVLLSSAPESSENTVDAEGDDVSIEAPAVLASLYGRWGALLRYNEEMEGIKGLFQRIEALEARPFFPLLALLIGLDQITDVSEGE
ncbi:hypothetical protein KDA_56800 [Dictyobacter alpinus]|uniref:Polyprenyl synthetase n=1 Tax=Dictyobacter alpinus TaxID=2014873 RepID=A0A402BFS0_9CHLR|nr:polyprenyl synthetase family protein [Dictyobacter alpinus]GCE30196.1 hypothetical protein KDA_56800 [Dictyobacter alpinus]